MSQNIPDGCVPFDLATALKHPERVRDEAGHQALRVIHIPEASPDYRVWVLWHGQNVAHEYTEDGRITAKGASILFLTAPEPTYVPWDNVDEVPDGWFRHRASGGLYRWDFVKPSENTVGWLDVRMSLPVLFQHYEWHYDRRHKGPWNVCGKAKQ